jgi:hypothetical protein
MLAGDDKELRAKALDAASKSAPPPSSGGPAPTGSSGFSASANIGGLNMSYKSPTATPAVGAKPAPSFAKPTAAPAASAAPKVSSTGKPMPEQEEGEEL